MGKSADLHTVYAFFFKVANIAHMKKICIANFSKRYIGLQQAPFPLAYTFREKKHFEVEIKDRERYNRN